MEDIYRPFKPKRRTRAGIAREKGLEPLADQLLLQLSKGRTPEELAGAFVSEENGVPTVEDALQGAKDIIAERVSDDAEVRRRLKLLYHNEAQVSVSAASDQDSVYRMYYDHHEPMRFMPGHRILAMNRGEKEGFLKIQLQADPVKAQTIVRRDYALQTGSLATRYVEEACEDAYDRLIAPSLDNELRAELTEKAQQAAVKVFAMNLKPLLMQPPVHGKVAIGLDPGIRTGCKVAVVDETGRVLDTAVIFPLPQNHQVDKAKAIVKGLIHRYGVSVAAIGNGTASRETEQFFVDVMHELGQETPVSYMIVSEAGASVYSASKLAA